MAAQDAMGMLVRIEATTAQLRAEMKRADAAVGNATKGIDKQLSKVDVAFDRLGVGAGKAASAVRALAPALAGLATLEALRRAQQLGEEFTLLEARIKRLSGGTAEAAVTYSRLAEVARQSGTSLGDTVKLWESLTGTLEELGATDAQVVRLTDTLQKIGTIGGSSAEEVSSALRQLGQGLAGGVIRAEEFNSVIEGMPELGREIARGLGVPFGELRQLMLDGELTAEKVLGAIQRRAFDVDAEFAKLPRTVSQASNALTNDFGRAIGEIDKAIGGSVNLARFLDTLAKGIRFTAGDFTDLERLNQLTAERAKLQQSYEQAERRTLLSAKERATFENGLKRLNTEILEIQNRRVQQLKEEGKAIQSNGPAQNEQYDKYLAKLKESAALQGENSEAAKVRYAIESGELGKLTEPQQALLLQYAKEKDAKVASAKAGDEYSRTLKDQLNALDSLVAQSDIAVASANAMADAYFSGADSVRKLTIEQKIEEQLLKTGQGAREAVTKAINEQQNALDRLDLGQLSADTRQQTKDIEAQIAVVLESVKSVTEGEAAQRAYNIEKQISAALAGKNASALSKETAELRKQLGIQEDLREELEAHKKIAGLIDSTATAQEKLNRRMEELNELMTHAKTPEQITAIQRAMKEAQDEASQWAQWTESSLERVDSAFADAWRNIGDGFSSFRDSLTNAFKQMLAELAHMAITRPIVMQIGAALGIGGGAGALASTGSLTGLGGAVTGSGGSALSYLSDAWSYGTGLYSTATSGFGQAVAAGWGNGGISGALSGGWNYAGNAASGLLNGGAQGGAGIMLDAAGNIVNTALPTWGGAATSLGSAFAGVGGALYGYGQSGLKGAATGALGGWGGATLGTMAGGAVVSALGSSIGATLGSVIPVIGTIIGGALGGFLGGSLFGGDWETKDGGIALGVDDGDFLGQSYEYQKKKGGLFGKNKKRTRFGELDPETAAALQSTFDATETATAGIFEALGFSINEGTLDGLELATTQISTQGKTEEEIQQAIAEWFGTVGNSMTAELNKVFSTGLDYDLAGMQAFVNNLLGVNEVLRYLDVGMYDASVAGGKLAEALSAAAGGLDALAANSQTYYGAFFSEAEKIEDTIDSVKRAFESADVELAGSREAYRAMVEDIDLTTQAGQEMFATLMALSGQAAQYYSILEQQAAQAYATLQANVAVYYEQFTTAGEKADDMLASVTASFEALELALPSSRDGFRAVVDGLDTSTEAGQRMFETLMSVAGAADAYYDILESRAAEAQAAAEAAEQALSAGYLAAVSVAQSAFSKMQESVAAERRALDDEYNAKLDVINAARDAVGSAIGRLRTAVEAEQDRLRAEQEAALDRVSELADLSDSLRSGLRAMRLESEQFDRMRRDQAKAQVSSALALARSGGSLQGLDLSDALSELSNSDTSGFASFEEYARDYWRTANDINELAGLTDEQLSVDEQIAKSLEEQSASLDEMLASAQSQYDALLGIDNAVLAVGDAVALFESSLVTAQQTASDTQIQQLALQHAESTAYFDQMLADAQRQMDILQGIDSSVLSVAHALANFQKATSVATSTPKTNTQSVASAYVEVLGRTAEADGLEYWEQQLASGAVTQAGLKDAIAQGALDFDSGSYTGAVSLADIEASKKAAAKYLGIPGFAAGGLHSGGLRLVGENGPELEVTGPSRIYNASQTAAMLGGGGDTAQAIASLQQSVERQGDALRSIAKHTMKTAKYTEYLERFDVDGLPKERGAA